MSPAVRICYLSIVTASFAIFHSSAYRSYPPASPFASVRPAATSLKVGDRPQFWGREIDGHRFALRETWQSCKYVQDSGLGEEIAACVTYFTRNPYLDSRRREWSFQISIRANGLRPYVRRFIRRPASSSAGPEDSWCAMSAKVPLHVLRGYWGSIPQEVCVTAALLEPDLPQLHSANMWVSLVPLAPQRASWTQKLLSLSRGQAFSSIKSVLGSPVFQFVDQHTGEHKLVFVDQERNQVGSLDQKGDAVVLDQRGRFDYFTLNCVPVM